MRRISESERRLHKGLQQRPGAIPASHRRGTRLAGLPVLGHVPRSLSTSRAIEIGMKCLEHIRVTGGELLPIDQADKIDYLPLGERETLLWERFDLNSGGMGG